MATSDHRDWWEIPTTYDEFSAAVVAQMPRWREHEAEINKALARIYTAHMVLGQPAPKAGFSTGLPKVRG